MTTPTALVLFATLSLGGAYFAPPFRTTLITTDVSPEGIVLAEPIYTPSLGLEPTNSVGRAIKKGEALQCDVGDEAYPARVDGVDSVVHSIVLNCDGARFRVRGIQFERSR